MSIRTDCEYTFKGGYMRYLRLIIRITGLTIIMLGLTGLAMAQWGSAVMEPVSTGTDNDGLGQSALALDDLGTLHLVFDRVSGSDHNFYYTQKLLGGSWIAPVPVGDPTAQLNSPYLDVHAPSSAAYLVYMQNGLLRLGVANDCVWEYYDLQTPYLEALYDPCLAVDSDGNAHVAFVVYHSGEYHLGYGYWEGPSSTDFHFQHLTQTQLGGFGSGASPDICVRSDGSVAICYRSGGYLTYQVSAIENAELGGSAWDEQTMTIPGYECYPGSIKSTPNDDLHLGFQGSMGFGFPNDIFYTSKPDGAYSWDPPVEVGGYLGGADIKLAVENNGDAHIVCMETSGNFYTGNIIYTTNLSGSWQSEMLLTGNDNYNPSLAFDSQGNGSLAFEKEIAYNNSDVYYYGYVAPIGPPPDLDVILTPESVPVLIGSGGGSFDYTLEVVNNGASAALFDGWVEIDMPGGGTVSPLILRENLTLVSGDSIIRDMTQYVPAGAPGGTYTYRLEVGDYPGAVFAYDEFLIIKSASDGEFSISEWQISGWDDEVSKSDSRIASTRFALIGAYPNPFNPVTAISYQLSTANHVNLSIFDLNGRLVSRLVDGWRSAGIHEVNFDGSHFASGVYVYRLTAGEFNATGKMILMK